MIPVDDIAGLDREALKRLWLDIFEVPPTPRASNKLMIRVLISQLQWQASSQSRSAVRANLEKALQTTAVTQKPAISGTRLIREWNGREYVVDVTNEGYLWKGRVWRSLSAIAKEITGTKWSGPRFFGVTV